MDNMQQMTNGGVKHVVVKELQDPDFILIRVVDNEGLGEELHRFTIRKDGIRPVPTLVEDHLLDNFMMGPSWSWVNRGWGQWEGAFASLTNHKVSDGFKWSEKN